MRCELRQYAAVGLLPALVYLAGCGAQVGRNQSDWPVAHEATVRQSPEDEAKMQAAMELITRLRYAEAAALLEDMNSGGARAALPESGEEARVGRPKPVFWLAFCREKMGALRRAGELYAEVANAWPNTKYARQATARRKRILDEMAEPADGHRVRE